MTALGAGSVKILHQHQLATGLLDPCTGSTCDPEKTTDRPVQRNSQRPPRALTVEAERTACSGDNEVIQAVRCASIGPQISDLHAEPRSPDRTSRESGFRPSQCTTSPANPWPSA